MAAVASALQIEQQRVRWTGAQAYWASALAFWPIALHALEYLSLPAPWVPYLGLALASVVFAKPRWRTATKANVGFALLLILLFQATLAFFASAYQVLDLVARVGRPALFIATALLVHVAARHLIARGHGHLAAGAFLSSIPFYILFTVLSEFATGGPEINYYGINSLLSTIGIYTGRLQAANNVGLTAAAALICLGTAWRGRRRFMYFACLAAALYLLLMADSRASAGFAVAITFVLHLLSPPAMRVLGRAVLTAGVAAPFVLSALFAWMNSAGINWLSRGGDVGTRLGAGTGRPYVWEVAFSELSQLKWEHWFGYGAYGHVGSQIYAHYQWIFPTDVEPRSLHSFTLQTILDHGYFGLILAFLLAWVTIGKLSRAAWMEPVQAKALIGLVIYMSLSGFFEVAGTYYHLDMYLFLLGVYAIAGISLARVTTERVNLSRQGPTEQV